MIRLVFSYAKSAILFVSLLCVCALVTVCVCLFTADPLDLALRIGGAAVLLFASYALSVSLCRFLIRRETERTTDAGALERADARLHTLARRALFPRVRSALLLQRAYVQLYRGLYKEAMLSASDAVIAGKKSAKGEAAVCFCFIFYCRNDPDYFNKYYETAKNALQAAAQTKDPRDRFVANARAAALAAMERHVRGDRVAALSRLRDFDCDGAPALQRKNLAALCEAIAACEERA